MQDELDPQALLCAALDKSEQEYGEDGEVEIPGYTLFDQIGSGGMGIVWRAKQVSLNREVAIKLMRQEVSADPEFKLRFRREAESMAALRHPNIVSVYDFGETDDGQLYLVMELVEGADLGAIMRAGPTRFREALNYTEQICSALGYAHELGFVHRDIKPANILLQNDGTVKMTDFGLARIGGLEGIDAELTTSGAVVGTPQYMAPEQSQGDDVDHRSDLFSLGVLIYELLTGSKPVGSWEPPSVKQKGISRKIDHIVAKAMESEPSKRFQSAAEFQDEISSASGSPAPAAAGDSSKWTTQRLALSAVSIVVLTAVVWITIQEFGPSSELQPSTSPTPSLPKIPGLSLPPSLEEGVTVDQSFTEFESAIEAHSGYVGDGFAISLEDPGTIIPARELGYRPECWRRYRVPGTTPKYSVLWILDHQHWAYTDMGGAELIRGMLEEGFELSDYQPGMMYACWTKNGKWDQTFTLNRNYENLGDEFVLRRAQIRRVGPDQMGGGLIASQPGPELEQKILGWRVEEIHKLALRKSLNNKKRFEVIADVSFVTDKNGGRFYLLWHEIAGANSNSSVTLNSDAAECLAQIREKAEAGWRPIALCAASDKVKPFWAIGWVQDHDEENAANK
ncbi:MAG: serine/threonine-protein kinase [Verrucomicrobiota bacterium]